MSLYIFCLTLLPSLAWGNKMPCHCAVMDNPIYFSGKKPIFEHPWHILRNCNEEGKQMCMQICHTLGSIAKEQPEVSRDFCKSVKRNIDKVFISIFSRACDGDYEYTGVSYDYPFCCKDGLNIRCK